MFSEANNVCRHYTKPPQKVTSGASYLINYAFEFGSEYAIEIVLCYQFKACCSFCTVHFLHCIDRIVLTICSPLIRAKEIYATTDL